MPYYAKIIEDSLAPCGKRLTTFEVGLPKWLLAEWNTHRLHSRNAASSRAIPTSKIIKNIEKDPVYPLWWGKNQKGMSASEELEEKSIEQAKMLWNDAKEMALFYAEALSKTNVHKQIVNRLLEPWMFAVDIVSATDYENFFTLRDTWKVEESPGEAQPELAWVAREMHKLYRTNTPNKLSSGEWHLPYVNTKDQSNPMYVDSSEGDENLVKISAARCGRVSYLTHAGVRDIQEDLDLYKKLLTNKHWSPLEHPAMALDKPLPSGNFVGFQQHRKIIEKQLGNKYK